MRKMNKNSKQRMLAGIALVIVVLLVASSVFVYYEYYREEEPVKAEQVNVIDERISPLENQGLVLEVLRIRHRGLYERLFAKGNSWKTKPSFYYISVIDDLEFKSKDVGQLGWMNEILFHTWDTMFEESKVVRDTEEEQETSTVKLSIVERVQVKKGLFRKTSQDIERDSLTVVYDYRTGRWSGDDSFGDYDGYGHYLGNTFEIWFNIYQMDYDLDYIPYWTEVNVLNTDPTVDDSKLDPDDDGVPTAWEWRWGYDPLKWDDHKHLDPDIDGIENIEEYQIAKWLSDPFIQDIYCEVDYMAQGDRSDPPHVIYEECQQAIIELYSRHNIQFFFDQGWPDTPLNGGGNVLPHYKSLSQDAGMVLRFYDHYFPEERRGIFHYLIGCHGGPFQHPAIGNVYDVICYGYTYTPQQRIKQWFQTKGKIKPWEKNWRVVLSQTLLHEIGHSVAFHPWIFEGVDYIKWGDKSTFVNYWSAMNYLHMYDPTFLDYSDDRNGPPYDRDDWTHMFIPEFEYNGVLIEEIYFQPPGFDKIVWGETEFGVTGYTYDENLTNKYEKTVKDWSPVDPTTVKWLVFKLDDKDKYPNYYDVKIFVRPEFHNTTWSLYTEGNLDTKGNIQTYSQQDIIDNIMLELKKSR
jgi:hypothetical protein